jgi:phosphoribosylformylglycinamidine (FGAM) synthase-like enzyme
MLITPPSNAQACRGRTWPISGGELGRELTDVEIACFENLWSEHCSYRSTKTLLRTLPTGGENVLVGPGDEAQGQNDGQRHPTNFSAHIILRP